MLLNDGWFVRVAATTFPQQRLYLITNGTGRCPAGGQRDLVGGATCCRMKSRIRDTQIGKKVDPTK